jgi:hypothetical protein
MVMQCVFGTQFTKSGFKFYNFFNLKAYRFIISPIFAKKNIIMSDKKRPTALYWLLFFVSIGVFFGVYAIGGGYCSMILPFNVTLFAAALDLM